MTRGSPRTRALTGIVLIAVVVGVVLGVTLSGGSGGTTKAQYVSRADVICVTTRSEISPLIKRIVTAAASLAAGGGGSAQQLAPLVERLHDETAAGLSELRALKQPAGARAAIEGFLRPLGRVVDALSAADQDLISGQPLQALALLQEMQPTAAQVRAAAQVYGLTDCSQLLSALG